MQTRWLVISLFLFAKIVSCGPHLWAQESAEPKSGSTFSKTVYTFKSVDDLDLRADVYRHDDHEKCPVIVWLHGGALIMGTREGVPQQILQMAEQQRYVVVSLDYRLAPEAQLDQIIEDLTDGLSWIQESGEEIFHGQPSRMVVAGASAGGYLALMSGVVTKPTAIVSYWGFGDVDGDWTTKPSEAYRKGKLISREDAVSGLGTTVLTATNKENGRGRSTYFLYLKQSGRWINEISGLDPKTDRDKLSHFCPVRNVTADFPPTLFLHGTADQDVPVTQTYQMAAELKRKRVPHEVIIIEGGRHSLWGGDPQKIEQAFARSVQYMHEQLSQAK